MPQNQLEKRVAALEAEVASLKQERTQKNRWWDKIAGTFAGDPLFGEAMKLGRQWRESENRRSLRQASRIQPRKRRK
jgi:hypothetical protein